MICRLNSPWWIVTEYWFFKIAGKYLIADNRSMTLLI